jgi:hypothetical protein
LRNIVADEIHARPVPSIAGPVSVLYLAFMKDKKAPGAARDRLPGLVSLYIRSRKKRLHAAN